MSMDYDCMCSGESTHLCALGKFVFLRLRFASNLVAASDSAITLDDRSTSTKFFARMLADSSVCPGNVCFEDLAYSEHITKR